MIPLRQIFEVSNSGSGDFSSLLRAYHSYKCSGYHCQGETEFSYHSFQIFNAVFPGEAMICVSVRNELIGSYGFSIDRQVQFFIP